MSLLDDRGHLRSIHNAHRRPVRRAAGSPVATHLLTCKLIKRIKALFAALPLAEQYEFWQLPCFKKIPVGDRSIECVNYRIEQAGAHTVAALAADLETRPFAEVVRQALDTRKALSTVVAKKRNAPPDDEAEDE